MFVWLGGIDRDGHGDLGNLLAVWAKLSIPVCAVDALLRAVYGEWPPMRVSRLALLSASVALLGYGFALWPQRSDSGAAMLPVFVVVWAATTAIASAWAVIVRRAAGRWISSWSQMPRRQGPMHDAR